MIRKGTITKQMLKEFDSIVKDDTEFDQWAQFISETEPKFYNYSLRGLSKESTLYQAKKSHIEKINKCKKELDTKDAKVKFDTICKEAKSLPDNAEFVSEDDLKV